eukprot:TRINITY_DN1152_c0_g1_i1.p2 TRINITY_DN1152_c0_g1~~TRINITY_DN1152_c0_g1_i1.p2  ORF type:complete len:211 (+),score=79.28 TRINITY_DN1152_c0_g1_i1:3-635(+)
MAAAAEEDARMAEKSGCEAVSLVTRLREELESMKELAAMASSRRLKAPDSLDSKGGQPLNDCGWDFDEDNSEGFQQWGAYGGGQERGEAQEEEEDGGSQERQQFEGQSSTGKDRESGKEEEEKVQAQDSKAADLVLLPRIQLLPGIPPPPLVAVVGIDRADEPAITSLIFLFRIINFAHIPFARQMAGNLSGHGGAGHLLLQRDALPHGG